MVTESPEAHQNIAGTAPELCSVVYQKDCDLEGVEGGNTPKHSLLRSMTQEQLTAFLANAKGNTSLQEKLKAAADVNAVAAIAQEAGFSISANDLKTAQSEISEEELEGAAGGHIPSGFVASYKGRPLFAKCVLA